MITTTTKIEANTITITTSVPIDAIVEPIDIGALKSSALKELGESESIVSQPPPANRFEGEARAAGILELGGAVNVEKDIESTPRTKVRKK